MRYVIITPVRDEEKYIEETLRSVVAQTIPPAQWVIVDDGSTDGTAAILERYAREHPWISVIRLVDRGRRDADTGAVGAFLAGYKALKAPDWEFLVNLDADLELKPDYFQQCFDEFRRDARLGIGGGTLYTQLDGRVLVEPCPKSHVRGATKICRRACWDAFGGLSKTVPAWDTFLDVKAAMAGWEVRTFRHIRAVHLRPTGMGTNEWHDCVKNGRSDYFLGYHPVFMLLKCTRRLFMKPYVLGGLAHLCGFLNGYLHRLPSAERPITRYVRRQQLRRLLLRGSSGERPVRSQAGQ